MQKDGLTSFTRNALSKHIYLLVNFWIGARSTILFASFSALKSAAGPFSVRSKLQNLILNLLVGFAFLNPLKILAETTRSASGRKLSLICVGLKGFCLRQILSSKGISGICKIKSYDSKSATEKSLLSSGIYLSEGPCFSGPTMAEIMSKGTFGAYFSFLSL